MFQATLKSWKTTTIAVLLALNAIGTAAVAMLDSDPLTNPDWNLVVTLIIAALGMAFAKDADRGAQL